MNMHLVLAMQQIGVDGSKAILLGGMLALCPAALAHHFSEIKERISLIQWWVSIQQLDDDMEQQNWSLEKEEDGELGLELSGNTRWDKCRIASDYLR